MLQEKTYFDVVSVKDELPIKANRYSVNYEEFPDIPESDYWDGEKFTDHIGKRKLTLTHWLKEKQGILLSKEQIISLLDNAVHLGYSLGDYDSPNEAVEKLLIEYGLK